MNLVASPRWAPVFALFVGGVAAQGLAPLSLWPLTIFGTAAGMLILAKAASGRDAFLVGWALGTGYFGAALLWIVEPFLVEPERHGWMAPFALVFMGAGLALFWATAFRLAFAAGRHRMAALVVWLGLAELARAHVLTGFPWAGLAQHWVGNGLDQSLVVIGPHGLGLVTFLFGWMIARALLQLPKVKWTFAAAIALPVLSLQASKFLTPDTTFSETTVRLVQPNARQDQKWDPQMIPVFLDRSLGYAAEGPPPDLIVWPETSIPTLLEYADPILEDMSAAAPGVPVIAGVQRRDDLRLYNSAVLVQEGRATQTYDKHHLVPFGEYIPFGDLAARFGLHGFAAREGQGFSAGPGPELMDLGLLGQALLLICYEAVFPQHSHSRQGRPDMLIQITNDGWFGERSGPYQHLAQARMRAIEQGLPMIRVANTGISAMIGPYGRVVDQIPLGQAGYVDAPLPNARPPTLYSRTGDWPVLVLLLICGLFLTRHMRAKA